MRQFAQHLIACPASVFIIDRFKTVNVDQKNGDRFAVLPRGGERFFQGTLGGVGIGHPGQRVGLLKKAYLVAPGNLSADECLFALVDQVVGITGIRGVRRQPDGKRVVRAHFLALVVDGGRVLLHAQPELLGFRIHLHHIVGGQGSHKLIPAITPNNAAFPGKGIREQGSDAF